MLIFTLLKFKDHKNCVIFSKQIFTLLLQLKFHYRKTFYSCFFRLWICILLWRSGSKRSPIMGIRADPDPKHCRANSQVGRGGTSIWSRGWSTGSAPSSPSPPTPAPSLRSSTSSGTSSSVRLLTRRRPKINGCYRYFVIPNLIEVVLARFFKSSNFYVDLVRTFFLSVELVKDFLKLKEKLNFVPKKGNYLLTRNWIFLCSYKYR